MIEIAVPVEHDLKAAAMKTPSAKLWLYILQKERQRLEMKRALELCQSVYHIHKHVHHKTLILQTNPFQIESYKLYKRSQQH